MATLINADTSDGLKLTSDTSGEIKLQSAGTDIVSVTANGIDVTGGFTVDTNTLYVDSTNNNVGIGTSSPSQKLEVAGTTSLTSIKTTTTTAVSTFQAANTSGTFYLGIDNSTGNFFGSANSRVLYADGAYSMNFYTNGTERMRIDSSGNTILGSNTSTTAYNKLNIYGPATTLNGIYMEKQSQVVVQMGFKADAGTDFFIGTGSYTLGTYGVYLANTGNSWISVSDERQKDIIEPIENALTKVNTLRAVIGKYKHDEEGVRRSFLIAQDVQAVFPEAVEVQKNEEALLGLSYTDIIPLLVAAIKEQQTINNDLTARIEALEAK